MGWIQYYIYRRKLHDWCQKRDNFNRIAAETVFFPPASFIHFSEGKNVRTEENKSQKQRAQCIVLNKISNVLEHHMSVLRNCTHTSTNVSSFTMQMYIFREMYDWWTIADSLYRRQSLSFTSLTIFHVVFIHLLGLFLFIFHMIFYCFYPSMNWSEQQREVKQQHHQRKLELESQQ